MSHEVFFRKIKRFHDNLIKLYKLGYDPRKKRCVGTFIGPMMIHLCLYEGTLDAEECVLTLNTEGPDCTSDESLAKY